MATKSRIVYGTSSEWSADSGTTYTNIPEVKALAVPVVEVEYIDVTNLDSAGGYREYIAGLKDAGEITLSGNYTSDLFETAFGYQTNNTLITFRTTLTPETGQTTGDVFTFTGLVTPRLSSNDVGEAIGIELVVRVSGNVTFVKGS